MESDELDPHDKALVERLERRKRDVEAERQAQLERYAKWVDWLRSTLSAVIGVGVVIALSTIYVKGIQSQVDANTKEIVLLHQQINDGLHDSNAYFKEQETAIHELQLQMKDKANRP